MFGLHLPNPLHAIERVGGDLLGDAGHWVAHNWKSIASIAVSTLAFAAVIGLCAICPFAVPGIVALAAAGFTSGVAFYGTSTLLAGRRPSWKAALLQGGLSAAITLGTGGLGRFIAPSLGDAAGQALATRLVTNTAVGAAFGTATQGVENLIEGKPLGDHLGDAAALGAVNGLLVEPARRVSGLTTGEELVGSEPTSPPRGIDTPIELPPPAKVDPIADLGQLADRSTTLARDTARLEAEGWKFVYERDPNKGTYTNYTTKTIAISDTKGSTLEIARSLAHEVGHAADGAPPKIFTPGMTRDEYIEANTRPRLLSEGAATLEQVEIEQQILESTGYDIGVSGQHAEDYKRIALDPTLTREQKIEQIAHRFAHDEVPSIRRPDGTRYENFHERTVARFGELWDEWMASPPASEDPVSAEPSAPPAPSSSGGFVGSLR